MRGSPFLRFYASDWRSGTLGLSFEAKGFYIDLLALMWDRQSRLPNDPYQIAAWLQVDPRKVRRLLEVMIAAGKISVEGDEVANRRLDEELSERRVEPSPQQLPPELPREVCGDFAAKSDGKSQANPAEIETKSTPDRPPLARAHSRNQKLDSKKDPPTPQGGPTPFEALQAFEQWNAMAMRCGLPQAAKLTRDRQRKIVARLKDYGIDGWMRALGNIEKSSFLTGANDRNWRASLEFLLQPVSFGKVYDGCYGNGRHAEKAGAGVGPRRDFDPHSPESQEIARMYAQ